MSLWDALCIYSEVEPTEVTVKEFRALATAYAEACGLVYDKSAKGNLAILHHLYCQPSVHPMLESSTDTTTVTTLAITAPDTTTNANVATETGNICNAKPTVTVTDANGTVMTVPFAISADSSYSETTTVAKVVAEDTTASPISSLASIDVTACAICDFSGSIEDLWDRYMILGPGRFKKHFGFTWSELTKESQEYLGACRRQLYEIVGRHHGKPTTTATVPVKSATSYNHEEFAPCGISIAVKHKGPTSLGGQVKPAGNGRAKYRKGNCLLFGLGSH